MKQPYIIGIGGGTCSGKSTLANKLEERLSDVKTVFIHMDKFYIRPPKTSIAPITGREYIEMNVPEALDLDGIYREFNTACDNPENQVVVIEGLFALYLPRLLERLDLKVFVDLKSDERIVRRIKRHMQGGETMDQVTDRYLDSVRYRHDAYVEPTRWRADVVFNGMLSGKEVDILASYIRSNL